MCCRGRNTRFRSGAQQCSSLITAKHVLVEVLGSYVRTIQRQASHGSLTGPYKNELYHKESKPNVDTNKSLNSPVKWDISLTAV